MTKNLSTDSEAYYESFVQHVGWLRHDVNEEVIKLLHQGHFEAAEQAFFWLYIRQNDTFIDCGSHVGLYSIIANKAAYGNARIISVEANKHTAKHLAFNLKSNGVSHATIINAAVWATVGKINFLEHKHGEAAYDHVVFESGASSQSTTTTTLNKLVEIAGGNEVALVKLDIEGAEPEAVIGGIDVIAACKLPLLMVEFTENNLKQRGLDTHHLFNQLKELGYTICEFHPERLKLEPFILEGPIWYKNLFACLDFDEVNRRLQSAPEENKKIASDIIARANSCNKYKELEYLESFKLQAEQSTKMREWAEKADAALTLERETSRQVREWAEKSDAALALERETSRQMREWAEKSDAALTLERETSRQVREWAEKSDAALALERETSRQMREWAEKSDAALTLERESKEKYKTILKSRRKLFDQLLFLRSFND